MMVSFVLSFFPRDVLDEILNLIESVSEDFPSYSTVRNEKRRDKMFTVTKQLKMGEFTKDTYFSLNIIFMLSSFQRFLTTCILNVVD